MKQIHDINYINKKQLATLNSYLREIVRLNSFYQKKYSHTLQKIVKGYFTSQDFFSLPFVEKDELILDQKNNPIYGTNLTYPQEKYFFVKSTSGSSGKPILKIPSTLEDVEIRAKVFGDGYRKLMKIKHGDRMLNYMIPNTSFYQLKTLNHIGYKVFSIEDNVDPQEIIDRIYFHQIESMETTSTKVFSLMKYARDNHIDPKSLPLKKIILIGEGYLSNLTARKLVKKYLNAVCFEGVGSTECGSFGKECIAHNGSHFINNSSIYEVINPDTLEHDTKGELVITTLWCSGYPLIRYRTGDYVEINSLPCSCGYPSSRIRLGSVRRIHDHFSVNGQSFSSIQFDEIMRKFVGVNNYFVKILNNRIIIKIEKDKITEQKVERITRFLMKKFKCAINIKLIGNADQVVAKAWKFNRIFDARTGPQPNIFIKAISKISRTLQENLIKNTPLDPW